MSLGKRTFVRLAGGIGVFFVLLAALLLLLPRLIDREWFRDKAAGAVSALVGGTVEIQAAELSYWPRPHLTIRGTRLEIPGTATGTVRSLVVYPRIVPLVRGKVQVSALRVETPSFSVTIPETSKRAPGKDGSLPAPAPFEEKLRSVLDSMARSAPDLRIALTGGRVEVTGGGLPPLSFREIEGYAVLPPSGPEFDLSCVGTLWERGSVKGRFEAKSLAGEGRIVLKGFLPHILAVPLVPGTNSGISDSDIDLDLRVESDRWAKFRAEVDLSLRRMALHRGKRRLDLAGGTVRGRLDRDGEKITAALTRLSLDSPPLSITGNLSLDGTARRSRAEAQARQIDLASVRDHALALAGDVSLVQDIFTIVKKGTLPVLAFRAEGKTAGDLWKLENMEVTGRIVDGTITVDAGSTDLTIERIGGTLAISQGLLTANGLGGSMGNVAARDGTFRMGLLGDDPPFRLEADVSADAADLPPLLNRLIPSTSFREELSRVEEMTGSVHGRLTLGETVDSIQAAVEIDAMGFSAKYLRLPYPLAVSGGRLLYRGDEIAATGVQGAMGKSTFSGLSGKVRMTEPPSLEVRSGEFLLSLDELYPWARANEGLRESLGKVQGLSGTAALSLTRIEGPALAPGDWNFDLSGNVEHLSLSIPSVPGTIEVAGGNFRATPETLDFEDLRAKVLDASLAVSGNLGGYRKDAPRGVATGGGRLGPDAIAFLHDRVQIPTDFLIHPPLEASRARLEWHRDSLVALSGNFVIGGGPKVSVDIDRPPGEWVVRNLSIRDEDSDASLSLRWKPGSLDLAFEGLLSGKTVNRMYLADSPSEGWLKGNVRASLRFDRPMTSTAEGTLEGKTLRFLQRMKIPVFVDSLSLSAEGSHVALQAAEITIGSNHLLLKGEATASPEGLAFDLDASTSGLDWESLREAFDTPKAKEGSPGAEHGAETRSWDLPVHGTVKLRSGYFRYGRHTVEPAVADIVFGKPEVAATITEAAYCGIPFTGALRATPGEMAFALRPNVKGGGLDSVYDCLTEEKGRITGRFDLTGEVAGRVREGEDPVRSLRGNLDFIARDGRIYGTPVLSRVLSFLNVMEIFQGKVPDIWKDGLEYTTLSTRAEIRDGNATITESVLDGSSLDMVGQGRVDLATRELDLQMLAAPFTTLNYVIGKIPLLGRILGGTLVEVPVKVSGSAEDPKVSLLEPAAVGKNLLGIVERTFLLPVELIRPILPGEEKVDR